MQINQPAGHLESGESLIEAAIRETREETAWLIEPQALIGIYRWIHPLKQDTYMRFCFSGKLLQHDDKQPLDDDIHQALWLSKQQILERQADCRSPLVIACIEDYLAGHRYPLEILHN